MFSLDTNAVIASINDPASRVRARFDRVIHDGSLPVGISSIVLFELYYGIAKSQRRRYNAGTLAAFLAGPIQVIPFDLDDAREAGEIRAALSKAGTPIGPYDVLIAAKARRRNATLVTANEREFLRVPGLKTQDWAAE